MVGDVHCNEIDKLETTVTKKQYKEFIKSNGFGYPAGQDCAANLGMPVRLRRRLVDEVAVVCGSDVEPRCSHG